jgi:ribosomal-protein-alanine N-acetyltransferase
LLEGKNVNLRVVEKEDLSLWTEWLNNVEFYGEYAWSPQQSRTGFEKRYDELTSEEGWFFIEKREGTKIGGIIHYTRGKLLEIGYFVIPSERCKGYCTEAVKIMVDYLFLSKDVVRVQAHIHPKDVASQKVLEKNGFKKEGTIRKSFFVRGDWKDSLLYSTLREEWKEPKILTKPASQC